MHIPDFAASRELEHTVPCVTTTPPLTTGWKHDGHIVETAAILGCAGWAIRVAADRKPGVEVGRYRSTARVFTWPRICTSFIVYPPLPLG